MAKYEIIHGHDIALQITKALGLENARRIIIDIGLESVISIYVEFLGDERLYDIDFTGLKLEVTEETPPQEQKD